MNRKFVMRDISVSRVACFAFFTLVTTFSYALTELTPAMSLEELTKSADEVVVGNVLSQQTRTVGGSFETDYSIQVNENLKTRSGELQQGQNFTLTMPGGTIQEPPVTQYVMGVPSFYKGEEVFLFLQKGTGKESRDPGIKARNTESQLTKSYKVVGWNQGRFSVATIAETGKKVVTRINLENYGVTNESDGTQQVVQAISQQKIPTVESNILRVKNLAAQVQEKDPLEVTGADGKKLKIERSAQKSEILKIMRNQQALAVQDFSDFKAQVKGFAVNGN